MGRFLLTLSYVGTGFSGLQKNVNASMTVAGVLEEVFGTWLNAANTITLVTSSRTDRGVHALSNTAHADIEHRREGYQYNPLIITSTVNKALMLMKAPLRVLKTQRVSDDFHARFNAIGRTYIYRIATFTNLEQYSFTTSISPFEYQRIYPLCSLIDMDKVKQVAEVLSGTHDFSAFTSHTRLEKQPWLNPVKTMDVQVERSKPFMHSHQMCDEVDDWEFVFHGNSFLYKQVRKMVGVMVAVGTGKMTIDDVHSLVNHPEKGTMSRLHKLNLHIPPHGLYLKEVHYKKQDLIPPEDDSIIDDTPILVEKEPAPRWVQRKRSKANKLKLEVPKPHAKLQRQMERQAERDRKEYSDILVSEEMMDCGHDVDRISSEKSISDTSDTERISDFERTECPENSLRNDNHGFETPKRDVGSNDDEINDTRQDSESTKWNGS